MADFQVSTQFIANTRSRSAQVNQNFQDVLDQLAAHHHDPNIYDSAVPITNSGIAPNAQIADTQLASQITRSGLINESALGVISTPGIISLSAVPNTNVNFGDGLDGDVDLDGVNTYSSFLSKASSTYTMTRNMYANNLNIDSGVTLVTDGYKIFVKGTISGEGTVDWGVADPGNDGNDSSGGTPGTGGSGGSQSGSGLLKNIAGASGGDGGDFGENGSPGSAGSNVDPGIGSDGADGGIGGTSPTKSPGNGGSGGSVTAPALRYGVQRFQTVEMHEIEAETVSQIVGAAGAGGGGGGAGTNANATLTAGGGGGGGASGGIIWIAARVWAGTFTIKSTGGDGGDGGDSTGSHGTSINGGGGGGAGGAGGVVVMIYGTKTWTGSYNLAGGSGGVGGVSVSGGGTGGTGDNGNTGTYYEIKNTELV